MGRGEEAVFYREEGLLTFSCLRKGSLKEAIETIRLLLKAANTPNLSVYECKWRTTEPDSRKKGLCVFALFARSPDLIRAQRMLPLSCSLIRSPVLLSLLTTKHYPPNASCFTPSLILFIQVYICEPEKLGTACHYRIQRQAFC